MSRSYAQPRPPHKPHRRTTRRPGRFGAGLDPAGGDESDPAILSAPGFGPFRRFEPPEDDREWWAERLDRGEPMPSERLVPPELEALDELLGEPADDPRWDDTRLCPCGRTAESDPCRCEPEAEPDPDHDAAIDRRLRELAEAFEPPPLPPMAGGSADEPTASRLGKPALDCELQAWIDSTATDFPASTEPARALEPSRYTPERLLSIRDLLWQGVVD